LRPRAPRVVAAGPFIGPPGGYPVTFLPDLLKPVRSVAEARAAVRTLVGAGAGVIKVGLTPRNPNLTVAELQAVVAEAHAARVRVSAHVEDSRNVRAALAAGVDDFAHMPRERNPALLRKVARAGVEIVGTLHVGSGSRQAARLANARAFVGAGGTLLYGTDFGNPGIPPGVDREEMRLMRRAGLSPLDLLRNATSRAGRVLGLPNIGRLRAGASADLVVVDGDAARDPTRVTSVPRLLLVRGSAVIDGTRFRPPAFGSC
jgi:imidazolonepropionase-like amidohydrolase